MNRKEDALKMIKSYFPYRDAIVDITIDTIIEYYFLDCQDMEDKTNELWRN